MLYRDLIENALRYQDNKLPTSHMQFLDPKNIRPKSTPETLKTKLIDTNILDKKGKPKVLWEDYRPYDWLIAERDRLVSEGDVAYFYQEYQNIPMDDSFRVFKKENISYWEGTFDNANGFPVIYQDFEGDTYETPVNIFMGVDPASSENIKADFSVIMVIGVDAENNIYIIDYHRGQMAPMDLADKLFEMIEFYEPKIINIEETGHVMLSDYMTRESKKMGKFYNISPKKAIKSKF
ncbi:MAG TPA: hypothetical protein DCM40_43465, partial [Maribacter sp.]|nr:hypothetical protein [Maribacter sp.]